MVPVSCAVKGLYCIRGKYEAGKRKCFWHHKVYICIRVCPSAVISKS